jgi:hypothetical protein
MNLLVLINFYYDQLDKRSEANVGSSVCSIGCIKQEINNRDRLLSR